MVDVKERFKQLSGYEFEEFIATLFKKMGYKDIIVTKRSGDEGRDIIMYKDLEFGAKLKLFVECKNWPDKPVGRQVIQKFHSAVITDPQVNMGIIVTTGRFSKQAIDYANKVGLKLIDFNDLEGLISKHQIFEQKLEMDGVIRKRVDESYEKSIREKFLLKNHLWFTFNRITRTILEKKIKNHIKKKEMSIKTIIKKIKVKFIPMFMLDYHIISKKRQQGRTGTLDYRGMDVYNLVDRSMVKSEHLKEIVRSYGDHIEGSDDIYSFNAIDFFMAIDEDLDFEITVLLNYNEEYYEKLSKTDICKLLTGPRNDGFNYSPKLKDFINYEKIPILLPICTARYRIKKKRTYNLWESHNIEFIPLKKGLILLKDNSKSYSDCKICGKTFPISRLKVCVVCHEFICQKDILEKTIEGYSFIFCGMKCKNYFVL